MRLKGALDRSALCPWLLWAATYVDVDDDDDDDDDEGMLPEMKKVINRNSRIWNIMCRNSRIWKTAIHAACRRPRV
jgi:hypothetical protein